MRCLRIRRPRASVGKPAGDGDIGYFGSVRGIVVSSFFVLGVGIGIMLILVFWPIARAAAGCRGGVYGAWRALLSGAPCPPDVAVLAGAGWQVMRLAALLMPTAAGRRWLEEAASFLAEAPPELCRGTVGSYLAGAPQVIAISWSGELARLMRRAAR